MASTDRIPIIHAKSPKFVSSIVFLPEYITIAVYFHEHYSTIRKCSRYYHKCIVF